MVNLLPNVSRYITVCEVASIMSHTNPFCDPSHRPRFSVARAYGHDHLIQYAHRLFCGGCALIRFVEQKLAVEQRHRTTWPSRYKYCGSALTTVSILHPLPPLPSCIRTSRDHLSWRTMPTYPFIWVHILQVSINTWSSVSHVLSTSWISPLSRLHGWLPRTVYAWNV